MPVGAVIGVVGAVAGAAESEQARKSGNTQRDVINAQNQDVLDRGKAIADRPYTPYTGSQVAPLSANENTAIRQASTGYAPAEQAFAKAGQQADAIAGSEWNQDTIDKYTNPYIKNVVNRSLADENTAYQSEIGDIGSKSAELGAFGGSQEALMRSEALKQHLKTSGDISATGYANAYKDAASTWMADNNRRLAAAEAYSRNGNDVANLNSTEITDLLKTGGASRMLDQMNLDTQYKNFIEQRDWSKDNFQTYVQAFSAVRGGGSPGPRETSTAGSQLLGTAATLAGYFGGSKSSAMDMNPGGMDTSGMSYIQNVGAPDMAGLGDIASSIPPIG